MGTFYEDEMMGLAKRQEMLHVADHARLVRLALKGQETRSSVMASVVATASQLVAAARAMRTVRSAKVSTRQPLGNRA